MAVEVGTGQPSYLASLRVPGVARICAAGVLGRLPESMAGICLLLLAHAHGGYAIGGIETGVLGLFSALAAGPVWGRLADRLGARPVVLATGLADAVATLLLGPAVRHGDTAGLIVSALVGALRPPVAGAVRAQWAALPPGPRKSMQALESSLTELVYILGPVLVSGILLVGTAETGLVVAGVLVGVGCVGLAGAPGLRTAVEEHRAGDRWGPLRIPALRLLCLVFGVQVLAFAGIEVGVTALCTNRGHAPISGMVLGVWAGGSAIGGLVYGVRTVRLEPRKQLLLLNLLAAALLLPFAAFGNPYLLFIVAIPAGLFIAPGAQTVNGLIARSVPDAQLTEAYGWVSGAAPALGASIGYSVGASLAQGAGPRIAIVVAAGCAAIAPVLVTLRFRDLPAG